VRVDLKDVKTALTAISAGVHLLGEKSKNNPELVAVTQKLSDAALAANYRVDAVSNAFANAVKAYLTPKYTPGVLVVQDDPLELEAARLRVRSNNYAALAPRSVLPCRKVISRKPSGLRYQSRRQPRSGSLPNPAAGGSRSQLTKLPSRSPQGT